MPGGPLTDQLSPGFIASERSPEASDLYMTAADMEALYGLCVEDGELRAAMTIIHAHTNRASLWPEPYDERLTLPDGFNTARLSARPVINLVGVRGRYGSGRRDGRASLSHGGDYYAAMAILGSSTTWQVVNIESIDLNPASGELILPTGFLPVGYTEIQVNYVAGLINIPDRIKLAMAEIINTIRLKGNSDRTYYSVGKIQTTWANTGYLSTEAKRLLAPYVVQALY